MVGWLVGWFVCLIVRLVGWLVGNKSKTEMAASVQGNKSKHTRGYNERYLIAVLSSPD